MNIFYLDHSPLLAAQYHCDKHVIKMILESVQILSTVARHYGVKAPYKPTHRNHPSVLWAAESYEHANWLHVLTRELNLEYRALDAVEAYRTYYAKGKAHLHAWARRGEPAWLQQYIGE